MVDKRWEKDSFQKTSLPKVSTFKCSETKLNYSELPTQNEKYTVANPIVKEIGSFICKFGKAEFDSKLKDLQTLLTFWKENLDYQIVQVQNSNKNSVETENNLEDETESNRIQNNFENETEPKDSKCSQNNLEDETKKNDSNCGENKLEDNSNKETDDSKTETGDCKIFDELTQIRKVLNVPTVKSRRGWPKGSKKPFTVFSERKTSSVKRPNDLENDLEAKPRKKRNTDWIQELRLENRDKLILDKKRVVKFKSH